MTLEEHKLVVFMLAQQFQRLMAVVEALKAKGVLEPDDLQAYDHLIHGHERGLEMHLFSETCRQYEDFARGLGMDVNLKDRKKENNPSDPQPPGR
jgi:hypothetical protein